MSLLTLLQTIKNKGFTPEITSKFSKAELRVIQKILEEYEEYGNSATLESLWSSDFEEKPVSIDEFLEDDYYLGRIGKDVFPVWRKDLRNVLSPLSPTVEWIIKGSIGSGKTFVGLIAIIYRIYYLLCLRNPQTFYGLAEGSPIVFGLFNIFKYLATATSYQYLTTWLREMSPYFANVRGDHLEENKNKKLTNKQILKLPKGIGIALGSTAINALGQNILGGLCDETEFGKSHSITSQEKSQVADLYHNVRTRMDSRFMQKGGVNPGLLCLISSARDFDQFLSKHVEQKKGDPHTYLSQYALYDVKEHVYKDSPRFTVVVGDKLHRSYILDDEPEKLPRDDARTIQVPVEFKDAFIYDIDTAIRDISGVETYGKTLFFPRRDLLLDLYEKSTPREHPFNQETITLSIADDVLIEDFFKKEAMLDHWHRSQDLWRPRFYPYADRFIHVDLAKNRDAAGFSMCCIGEEKEVTRITADGMKSKVKDYSFFFDIMLRIRAAHGSEIDFAKIRRFIFFLRDTCHFKIVWVSYDSYQSTDSIQAMKKANVKSKELSLDKKPGPYRAFKSILLEERADMYMYEPFFAELTKLEDHTAEGGKIDHPSNGSKDVADSACGAVNGALIYKGVTISGTDAQDFRRRAMEYQKQMEVTKTLSDSISAPSNPANSLERFFEE